jgi:hypothetical protein
MFRTFGTIPGASRSRLFEEMRFVADILDRWRIPIDFSGWIDRIRTPEHRVQAIRTLWNEAPQEVRTYFAVKPDFSFELDALMVLATPR